MEMKFNTENIEEAVIVEKTESSADDLLKRVKAHTEIKTPGSASTTKTEKKPFWERSEEDFAPKKDIPPVEKKPDGSVIDKKEEATDPKPSKMTEQMKRASARTAVGMVDLSHQMLLTPLINYKFKKKFTSAEMEAFEKVAEADIDDLDKKEAKLRKKIDFYLDKRDKQKAGIPLTKTEKEDTEELFYNYFDIKQTQLSPEWGLVFGLMNVTGTRVISVLTS